MQVNRTVQYWRLLQPDGAPLPGEFPAEQVVRRLQRAEADGLNRYRRCTDGMLLIGGGKDLIAPASMTEAIFKKQKHAASLTELKILEDRSHYTCLEPGWEEVADFALAWAEKNQRAGDFAKAA